MKILTGIDLPFLPSCGSMILCNDLYKDTETKFVALKSLCNEKWHDFKDISLLNIEKEIDISKYDRYVDDLFFCLQKIVQQDMPDIIHIQHLTFGMAKAFIKIKNIPKIAFCHGTDILFAEQSEFHLRNMIEIYENVSKIIFPTQEMQIKFELMTGCKNKSVVIPWGIPIDKISKFPKKTQFPNETIHLLFAGRLTRNKNPGWLIKLLEKLPNNFDLTIIGNGDVENELKDEVKKSTVSNRVYFYPFMKRERLWKIMHRYDLLIIPTQSVEAFCLTAVEAQLLKLPIAYANTGGLKNVIQNTGIAFELDEMNLLVSKILQLFKDKNYYKKIQESAFNHALNFDINITKKQIMSLSKKIKFGETI